MTSKTWLDRPVPHVDLIISGLRWVAVVGLLAIVATHGCGCASTRVLPAELAMLDAIGSNAAITASGVDLDGCEKRAAIITNQAMVVDGVASLRASLTTPTSTGSWLSGLWRGLTGGSKEGSR